MEKNYLRPTILKVLFIAAVLTSGAGMLSAQQDATSRKVPFFKTLPSASFLTVNAEYLGGYRPDQFFSAQVPAFGFKAGTMRNVGWYVGAMTNFKFKGAFVTCTEDDITYTATSSTYFDALAGITLRYWAPLSFHLGLGYSYRSFNNETVYGQWAHLPSNISQGPAAAAGFMFHLGGFVVSAEVVGSYNLQGIRTAGYPVEKTRFTFGAKAGLGLCIPYRYRTEFQERNRSSRYSEPVPAVSDVPAPAPAAPQPAAPAPVSQPEPTVAAPQPAYPVTAPQPAYPVAAPQSAYPVAAPQPVAPVPQPVAAMPQPAQAPAIGFESLRVHTMPISQLMPGSVTVCGQAEGDETEPVIDRGICWGTDPYPSVMGPHSSDGTGLGYFTTVVSGLQPGTVYYLRAYAGTRSGIRYGNTVSVTIPKQSASESHAGKLHHAEPEEQHVAPQPSQEPQPAEENPEPRNGE